MATHIVHRADSELEIMLLVHFPHLLAALAFAGLSLCARDS